MKKDRKSEGCSWVVDQDDQDRGFVQIVVSVERGRGRGGGGARFVLIEILPQDVFKRSTRVQR